MHPHNSVKANWTEKYCNAIKWNVVMRDFAPTSGWLNLHKVTIVNMLYYTILCYAMLCYTIPYYTILYYAILCYAMLCYDMIC